MKHCKDCLMFDEVHWVCSLWNIKKRPDGAPFTDKCFKEIDDDEEEEE